MSQQRGNRSRKRNATSDTKTDSNKNKKQKVDHNDNQAVPTALQLVDLTEYHCCVCKELSAGQILQCSNGCILCEACYHNLSPCKCPLCRVTMSRSQPIRCRIAERTLALRLMKCKYDGCGKQVAFDDMKQHETEECLFKPVPCKYADLGCQWMGLRQQRDEHMEECAPDRDVALDIMQATNQRLQSYKQFTRKSCRIRHLTFFVGPAANNNNEFEVSTDDFDYEGYEYIFRIQSKKQATSNTYKIFIKLEFAEDPDDLTSTEEMDIDVGVVLETYGNDNHMLLKHVKEVLSKNRTDTGWISMAVIDEAQCQKFRANINLKIFCFDESD